MEGGHRVYIVNPAAGGGRARRIWQRLHRGTALPGGEARFTEGPGHAEELARAACLEGAGAVFAVGGDGTLNEVVNGCLKAPVPGGAAPAVGVIPCGTGNDFARGVGLPVNPGAALAAYRRSRWAAVDVGRLDGRYFVNIAGFGFDAEVAADVLRRTGARPAGTLVYLASVARVLRRYRPREFHILADEQRFAGRFLFGAVGNGTTYGGGMRVCPRAEVGDGRLDLCLAGDLGRAETCLNLLSVFRGTHLSHPKCKYRQVRRLRVEGDAQTLVHADGQLAGSLPLEIEVVPGALRLLVPEALAAPAGPRRI